eukprot:2474661-Pleurochrysis_carterae.AAC.4
MAMLVNSLMQKNLVTVSVVPIQQSDEMTLSGNSNQHLTQTSFANFKHQSKRRRAKARQRRLNA